ncbi:hypothetical protein A3A03_03735 [Candidatus Nomurabacteria bacterium RIFCSPLOWO2_01_FULL_40_18]|uniref:Fibronectin type-III domain-containing protein n=1 Tax=Candidatus Nomurabacteria bacterium RIFCSPLOWO2_01_FULL_40_18 TaxID=1801773 RepID=A0A1F6XIF4_9BACT|nr:MAG: hypothetical protein A3A03_03735 [Candidatus Nomurabacteria bacterium RIFCSPLOWO2_01_FULL_40_18]
MKIFSALILSLMLFSVVCSFVLADFTSTNFQLENPINIISGGESTSYNFQYFSTTSQIIQGQSTSSDFAQNAGFLYFPTATSPVLSATPGNTQVTLSWTASTGILANITSYEVGTSTTSGGSFAFTSVGTSLNTIKTDLTNGTTYYFKVRSYAAGLLLSESAEVTATPVVSVGPGGGGGGGGPLITTGANFSGRAYPGSRVFLLKDGQTVATTIAGGDANFKINLTGLSSGDYSFLIYAEDQAGRRSTLFTFPVTLTLGATSEIGGIFIAPTIALDKEEVKKGDNITILGQSVPNGQISISVHSNPEFFIQTISDRFGGYVYNFDTAVLDLGDHLTKSKASDDGLISQFGKVIGFKVGNENVLAATPVLSPGGVCGSIGDLNGDCRVNLVDYSILAFWYKKNSPPANVDLNYDNKVDIIDFSILAHYWTT